MKYSHSLSLVFAIGFVLASAFVATAQEDELKTVKDKASYAIGVNIGRGLKAQDLDVDPAVIARGLYHAMKSDKTLLSDDDMKAALDAFEKEHTARVAEKLRELAEKNKVEGEKYLADHKSKPGVKETASGALYTTLKEGTGATPTIKDVVKVHYTGKLIDGTVFDSSVERGEPLTIPVGGVIRGWTEALQKMKVGGKASLVIPSQLAYGETGRAPNIGPNAVLLFEVELLDIVTPESPN